MPVYNKNFENKKLTQEFSKIIKETRERDVEFQGWVVESSPGEYTLEGVHSGTVDSVEVSSMPSNTVVGFHTHTPGFGIAISDQDELAAAIAPKKPVFNMIIGTSEDTASLSNTKRYDGNGNEIDCEEIWDKEFFR